MVVFGALLQPNMPRNALFPLKFSLACLYLLQLLEKPPKTLLESAIGMPKIPKMPQTFTWTSLDFLIVVKCSNGRFVYCTTCKCVIGAKSGPLNHILSGRKTRRHLSTQRLKSGLLYYRSHTSSLMKTEHVKTPSPCLD